MPSAAAFVLLSVSLRRCSARLCVYTNVVSPVGAEHVASFHGHAFACASCVTHAFTAQLYTPSTCHLIYAASRASRRCLSVCKYCWRLFALLWCVGLARKYLAVHDCSAGTDPAATQRDGPSNGGRRVSGCVGGGLPEYNRGTHHPFAVLPGRRHFPVLVSLMSSSPALPSTQIGRLHHPLPLLRLFGVLVRCL